MLVWKGGVIWQFKGLGIKVGRGGCRDTSQAGKAVSQAGIPEYFQPLAFCPLPSVIAFFSQHDTLRVAERWMWPLDPHYEKMRLVWVTSITDMRKASFSIRIFVPPATFSPCYKIRSADCRRGGIQSDIQSDWALQMCLSISVVPLSNPTSCQNIIHRSMRKFT